MEPKNLTLNVQSEIGKLEAVMLHYPGPEVENMTPKNAQRALYSDILNLSIAQQEYAQLQGVLKKTSRVYEVSDLLEKLLSIPEQRFLLLQKICATEQVEDYFDYLLELPANHLAKVLIEGLPMQVKTLTDFLKEEYYALQPLYNFYFTRDTSVTIGNTSLVCKMANAVRVRESFIMEAILNCSLFFTGKTTNMYDVSQNNPLVKIEGGDVLVAREDILLIGSGARTSPQAVDLLINELCKGKSGEKHIIVQQLPETPESFIHLDMVFTLLDKNTAMIYKPLIMGNNPHKTVHIKVKDGKVAGISQVNNIPAALKKLGMEVEPIICGGKADDWDQEREQWHSGANFLAIAPGKVLSYARNVHTLEELNKNGFEIVRAWDVIDGKFDLETAEKCVITLDGSELPRGGGGPRCMTMPLRRE
ncbi:MAG: arginine deiminase family protein [Bacteroidia bacterium]|nr:arginine deiminase family protein [Bacteroidia bacterium]